jgi:hypothetical protein
MRSSVHARGARRALLLVALTGAAAAACSSTPPPKPLVVAKPAPLPPPPPAPPPLPPARWVESGGATVIGPVLESGTLVLVGGRRALVTRDGTLRPETTPAPEPLQEIVEVPVAGGRRKLVARGDHGVFRLDDPLGPVHPLTRSESDLRALGAGAGAVAVWTYGSDVPRFLDVETGRTKSLATLPPLPLRAVAFRNEKEGAGIFEGVGLATTADGGATWKTAAESVLGDGLRVIGVRVRGDALRAFVYDEGRDAPIDAAAAKLGMLADEPAPGNVPPLLRWIRATHRDPLALAANSGVELPGRIALVASHGLLARVDLATGLVTTATEFARGTGLGPCQLAHAGSSAFIACAVSEDEKGDFYDPFGVMRVPLDRPELEVERPALVRNGESDMRASPSGGVMLMSACASDEEGEACVRKPDGTWQTLRSELGLIDRGAGPLGDGRVAFFRNMYDGDTPSGHTRERDDEAEERGEGALPGEEGHESSEIPESERVYIATFDASGKEERLATLAFRPMGEMRIMSPLEEGPDHTLHAIISDDEGIYAVAQPVGAHDIASTPERLTGIAGARIHGGRGLGAGEERVQASIDGGKAWREVLLPERVRKDLGDIAGVLDDPSIFNVSEVGAQLDRHLRIGWGAPETIDEPKDPLYDVTLPPPQAGVTTGPDRLLTCSTEATAQGTPPLSSLSQATSLLGNKNPAPKGTRRAVSTAPTGRNGLLDVIAVLEEEGPDKPGALPARWTLAFHDPAELSGKPRTLSLTPPKDTPWGARLAAAWGTGARALFHVRAGSKNLLLRTKGAGFELATVTPDLLPGSDVVFGGDKGEPVAWLRGTSLIVWLSGESPRAVGFVGDHALRLLGEPTKDGIPVLVSAYDWSALRVFPIPALDKKAAAPPAPFGPTLADWTAAPNVRQELGRLPTCAGKPKGQRFLVARGYARAAVDGANGSMSSALYDVRLSGNDACVAQIAALVTPDRGAPPAAPDKKGGPKKGPVAFLRADFANKRGEGGERGVGIKDAMRRLTCSLEEKR